MKRNAALKDREHTLDFVAHRFPAGGAEMYPYPISDLSNLYHQDGCFAALIGGGVDGGGDFLFVYNKSLPHMTIGDRGDPRQRPRQRGV